MSYEQYTEKYLGLPKPSTLKHWDNRREEIYVIKHKYKIRKMRMYACIKLTKNLLF